MSEKIIPAHQIDTIIDCAKKRYEGRQVNYMHDPTLWSLIWDLALLVKAQGERIEQLSHHSHYETGLGSVSQVIYPIQQATSPSIEEMIRIAKDDFRDDLRREGQQG